MFKVNNKTPCSSDSIANLSELNSTSPGIIRFNFPLTISGGTEMN